MFSRFSLSGAELTNSAGAVKGKKYGYQLYFVAELLWKSSKIKSYSSTPNMKKKNDWKIEISKAMPHKTHEQKSNVTNRNLTKITIIMKE